MSIAPLDLQDDRPPLYFEDGKWVFRSSAIGSCSRQLIALGIGHESVPPAPWIQRIYDLGHELEPYIIKATSAKTGLGIEGSQYPCELEVGLKAVVRSHLDGLAFTSGDPKDPDYIVEAKGLGKTYMTAHEQGRLFDVLPTYAWQISVQMHAMGLPVLYTVYDKREEGAEPWNLDLDQLTGRIHTTIITEPPIGLGEIKKKVAEVIRAIDKGNLPDDCDLFSAFCSVPYLHDNKPDDLDAALGDWDSYRSADELEEEDQQNLTLVAGQYAEVRTEEARLKAKKKALGKRLEALLTDSGAKSLDTGRFKVTRVTQNRSRMDKKAFSKALEAAGIDENDYKIPHEISFVKVTDREAE